MFRKLFYGLVLSGLSAMLIVPNFAAAENQEGIWLEDDLYVYFSTWPDRFDVEHSPSIRIRFGNDSEETVTIDWGVCEWQEKLKIYDGNTLLYDLGSGSSECDETEVFEIEPGGLGGDSFSLHSEIGDLEGEVIHSFPAGIYRIEIDLSEYGDDWGTLTGEIEIYDPEEVFPDVIGHWAEDDIFTMYEQSMVVGYPDGFRPEQSVTRAEFLKLLIESLDYPSYSIYDDFLGCLDEVTSECEEIQANPTFNDVNPADWFYFYIEFAAEHDMAHGYPDGGFHPNEPITRAEGIALIVKVLQDGDIDPDGVYFAYFDDLSIEWQIPYVMSAYNIGLLNSLLAQNEEGDNSIYPNQLLTRAESAHVAWNANDYPGVIASNGNYSPNVGIAEVPAGREDLVIEFYQYYGYNDDEGNREFLACKNGQVGYFVEGFAHNLGWTGDVMVFNVDPGVVNTSMVLNLYDYDFFNYRGESYVADADWIEQELSYYFGNWMMGVYGNGAHEDLPMESFIGLINGLVTTQTPVYTEEIDEPQYMPYFSRSNFCDTDYTGVLE